MRSTDQADGATEPESANQTQQKHRILLRPHYHHHERGSINNCELPSSQRTRWTTHPLPRVTHPLPLLHRNRKKASSTAKSSPAASLTASHPTSTATSRPPQEREEARPTNERSNPSSRQSRARQRANNNYPSFHSLSRSRRETAAQSEAAPRRARV